MSAESVADKSRFHKFDEVPYDFIRKRLSVVVECEDSKHLMITKGAFANVLDCCTQVAYSRGVESIDAVREELIERFERYSNDGFRVLGLAYRDRTDDPRIDKDDEVEMTFAGFFLFEDPPKIGAADVGISVDSAVDVAKQAADMVLLRHDLGVIARGVVTGRGTFANSIKYVLITTSANFGNMVSMVGASLFLPFLPLLPKQILLNNFLSDLPSLAISTDSVDPEQIAQAHRWDQRMIRRFMIVFGAISSLFDFLTFGTLLWVLKASEAQFQTGWFLESLITELTIVMIIRTRRSFYQSRPGKWLALATSVTLCAAFVLPYTELGGLFGLVPLPWWWLFVLVGITGIYLAVNEQLKHLLYVWLDRSSSRKR
ncbi:MAG: cation transporting ATPase C-terminal domain-containing protein [Planctomycetota bacterium]